MTYSQSTSNWSIVNAPTSSGLHQFGPEMVNNYELHCFLVVLLTSNQTTQTGPWMRFRLIFSLSVYFNHLTFVAICKHHVLAYQTWCRGRHKTKLIGMAWKRWSKKCLSYQLVDVQVLFKESLLSRSSKMQYITWVQIQEHGNHIS